MKAPIVLLVALGVVEEVSADSCVSFTSTVDGAGDPGPGSDDCSPYNIEVAAVAGSVLLSEASESATSLAPAMDISVLVDESGSVIGLCGDSTDCYFNEQDFALELVTLLDDGVSLFDKGGTAQYIEYGAAVNTNQAFTNRADYIACEC